MKVELAKYSGFCMGVRNAVLKIINEINSSDEEIKVYGPLIHNPQTIEILARRGVKTIKNLDEISNSQVAIRTHGIPIDEYKIIKDKAARVINLTCPRVIKVQSVIKKYAKDGYFTIITGDKDHAEVIGLKSYASAGVHVMTDESDIQTIPQAEKYLIVSQTTFDRKLFNRLIDLAAEKKINAHVIDTICDSTRERQDFVSEAIKENVTCLVVVGGKNSANTTRLAQIGIDSGIKTFMIETEDELKDDFFSDEDHVLVTAGASTPGWIINNVLEKLHHIKYKKGNWLSNFFKNLAEMSVRMSILSSVAAFFMSITLQNFIGNQIDLRFAIIASFYIFSMYSMNNFFDKDFQMSGNSYKYNIYRKYGLSLFQISIFLIAISLFILYSISLNIFIIVISAFFLGFVYSTKTMRNIVSKAGIKLIEKIYSSKIVTSFGWVVVLILPALFLHIPLETLSPVIIFFFGYVFIRQYMIDVIAFQGDLVLGRETIPIIVGSRKIHKFLKFTVIGFMLLFTAAILFSGKYIYSLLITNFIYFLFLTGKIKKHQYLVSLKYEILVDWNFIFMILISIFIWIAA